jgi:hypothetical protein
MNKVILVMGDPMFCFNCPLARNKKHRVTKEEVWYCGIAHKTDKDYYWEKVDMDSEVKPDWCPLKAVPEKYDMYADIIHDMDWDGEYESGYNACIDEILRGEDNE